MSNIAEGFLRQGRKEFAQFTRIAYASNGELRSHLYVAEGRGYVTAAERATLAARSEAIARMLRRLQQRLQEPSPSR